MSLGALITRFASKSSDHSDRQSLTREGDTDEKNASYKLEFEVIPIGEIFRKYILHVFSEENLNLENSSMLDRIFKVYLFPIYLAPPHI